MRRAGSRRRHCWHGCSGSAPPAVSISIAVPWWRRRKRFWTAAGATRHLWCGWRGTFIVGGGRSLMDVQEIRAIADAIRGEVRKAVVGQDAVIDLMLTSLLVGGHILLEGVPGTAKTLITRAFAAGLALQF